MEHVFSAWQDISRRLKEARHILLLSDYDGTLTPIVERPELADLSEETRELLRALARQRRFTVGIISGRALRDLQARVGVRGIVYAGNHGLEIEGPGVSFVNPLAEEVKPILRVLHQVLSRALASVRGVLVEDKGLTLSVHYRLVEEDKAEEVWTIFERIMDAARSLGKVRATSGKKVLEVRPAIAWDKGRAIALLLEKCQRPFHKGKVLAVFLGDDLTDEDGFRVVEKGNGISIFVGEENPSSQARYFLKSPAEVQEFLARLQGRGRQGTR